MAVLPKVPPLRVYNEAKLESGMAKRKQMDAADVWDVWWGKSKRNKTLKYGGHKENKIKMWWKTRNGG